MEEPARKLKVHSSFLADTKKFLKKMEETGMETQELTILFYFFSPLLCKYTCQHGAALTAAFLLLYK